jgi:hypothetical protein
MDVYPHQGIKRLREKIECERIAICALETERSVDADQLSDLMALLDIIDNGFLRQDILCQPRSTNRWDWWLGRAGNLLLDASTAREEVSVRLPKTISPVALFLAKQAST